VHSSSVSSFSAFFVRAFVAKVWLNFMPCDKPAADKIKFRSKDIAAVYLPPGGTAKSAMRVNPELIEIQAACALKVRKRSMCARFKQGLVPFCRIAGTCRMANRRLQPPRVIKDG
jgi:hypothetical protein